VIAAAQFSKQKKPVWSGIYGVLCRPAPTRRRRVIFPYPEYFDDAALDHE
jgi:hypothetical protein